MPRTFLGEIVDEQRVNRDINLKIWRDKDSLLEGGPLPDMPRIAGELLIHGVYGVSVVSESVAKIIESRRKPRESIQRTYTSAWIS
jgi:hypothetical protein